MTENVRSFLIAQDLIAADVVPSHSGEFRVKCIECSNDANKCYINALGRGVNCKQCGLSQSWKAFKRRFEPPSLEEQAFELFVSICAQRLEAEEPLMEYLTKDRGFTLETIKTARLGYCDPRSMYEADDVSTSIGLSYSSKEWVLKNRIIIPYLEDGVILKVRGRANPFHEKEKAKYLDLPSAQVLPFIPTYLDPTKPTVVAEGELSALMLRQHDIQALAIPGAQTFDKSWTRGLTNIFVALDPDDAGRQGLKKFIDEVQEFRRVDLPEGFDVDSYINTFGIDSFNRLLDNAVLYLHKRPQKDDRFDKVVDDFSSWIWTNDRLLGPKISWAPRLEEILSGWAPGLILIGAEGSTGKSTFIVKSLYELCTENEDVIGVYLSLDDTWMEAMLRLTSLHSQIDFNQVRSPRESFDNPFDATKKDPEKLARFLDAVDTLKNLKDRLILRDVMYGNSLPYLRTFFEALRNKHPHKRIVVFIDSLAKISSGGEDKSLADNTPTTNWKSYIAKELKYLTTKHNICLVTPTDLSKINSPWQQPQRADLKDAAELDYEANVVILISNMHMKLKAKCPLDFTWYDEGTSKTKPIIRCDIAKNKITGKRSIVHFYFDDELCDFSEATREQSKEFEQALDQGRIDYYKKNKEL